MKVMNHLSYWLTKRKIKQAELARMLKKCHMSVWRWVHGVTYPSILEALEISKILKCKVDDIWKITD